MTNTLTYQEIINLVNKITYKPNWVINIFLDSQGIYIQGEAESPCSVSGIPTKWRTPKARLSKNMCRQEIVSAVYGMIERAELHECREFFRYKGAAIFNPHLDPDSRRGCCRE